MRLKFSVILIALLAALSSCKSSHEKMAKSINNQIDSLVHAVAITSSDAPKAASLETSINSFVKQFPGDTLSPHYLFQMGRIYESRGRFKEAIEQYDHLQKDYPKARQNGIAIYMEATIYNNQLGDVEKAREKYQFYLTHYAVPGDYMTKSAEFELSNLGKSAKEIFEGFDTKKDSIHH